MTVPAQDRFTFSSGNGVTTTFPYTFMIPGTVDDPQFLVYLIEIATGVRTDLTVDVDYSIAGLGVEEGGVVTYPLSGTPLAATHRLVIESNMPYEQQTDVYNSGTLYLSAIEDQFDNTTRQVQQIQDRVNRTFSVGIGYEGNYELFPVPDRLIGWNSTGTALENKQSESESAAGAYAAQLAAEAAQAAAEAAAAALPPIAANTMLVDNAAGTARETKTFAQVNECLGSFTTKTLAAAATIDTTITSVRLGGGTTLGDGLGGLYISTNNGSADTFSSNGGTRTWYRALFDLPTIASGDAGKIVAVNATEDGFALEVLAAAPTPFVTPRTFNPSAGSGNVAVDTAACQSAMAVDAPLYIDRPYLISAALTHSNPTNKIVYGNGHVASLLTMTNATQNGLVKTGGGSLIVRDLGITTNIDKSAGAAIATSGTSKDRIDNCMIYGPSGSVRLYEGIVINGLIPNVTFNYVLTCKNVGISLGNTSSGQGVEAVIFGNTLNTSDASNNANGILWNSGLRTLRVFGNIIQNYAYGMQVVPATGYSPQSLNFSNNILESNSVGGLVLSLPAASTSILENAIICGNEFNQSTGSSIITAGATNLTWVKNIHIVNNAFNFSSASQVLLQAGSTAFISGNSFQGATVGLVPVHLTAGAPSATLFGYNQSLTITTLYALNGNTGAYKTPAIVAA